MNDAIAEADKATVKSFALAAKKNKKHLSESLGLFKDIIRQSFEGLGDPKPLTTALLTGRGKSIERIGWFTTYKKTRFNLRRSDHVF